MTQGREWTAEAVVEDLFAPAHTALLVIDVQNDFCAPGGFFDRIGHPLDDVQQAVGRIEALLPAARRAGVKPIFVRGIYDREYVSEAMLARHQWMDYPLDVCLSDTWGSEFYRLSPEPDDPVITKHRYSAFIDTDLSTVLRSNGIRSLILTGVATNVCVESTARDGFMLDYHIMLLSDCAATYKRELHESTLENIRRSFGLVAESSDLIAAWERASAVDGARTSDRPSLSAAV